MLNILNITINSALHVQKEFVRITISNTELTELLLLEMAFN